MNTHGPERIVCGGVVVHITSIGNIFRCDRDGVSVVSVLTIFVAIIMQAILFWVAPL